MELAILKTSKETLKINLKSIRVCHAITKLNEVYFDQFTFTRNATYFQKLTFPTIRIYNRHINKQTNNVN